MWVLPEKKMCFLANPKTASLSTAYTLETLGFKHYGDQHCTPDRSGWDRRHEIDETWTTFCTIRNHFDTMVSWYFHQTARPGKSKWFGSTFESFLYDWVHNSRYFRGGQMYWERYPWCSKVMRFERLQVDFDYVLTSCGLPATTLQVHNVSKNRKRRACCEFYSEASIKFMEKTFGDEMRLLGYTCWE
jgi:hypothetical protein